MKWRGGYGKANTTLNLIRNRLVRMGMPFLDRQIASGVRARVIMECPVQNEGQFQAIMGMFQNGFAGGHF
jgi:hypothetical protein